MNLLILFIVYLTLLLSKDGNEYSYKMGSQIQSHTLPLKVSTTLNSFSPISSDEFLSQKTFTELHVADADSNFLEGSLSGTYNSAQYFVLDDIIVDEGDTVHFQEGSKFLFGSGVSFNVYGTLKAIGTESDSIIFDRYGDERWRGFSFENVSDETMLKYVRISGSQKEFGGGIYLKDSSPTLSHAKISDNIAELFDGGGLFLNGSSPKLEHMVIANNTANNGGGIYMQSSDPILTDVEIKANTANYGGGLSLSNSNPIIEDSEILFNDAENGGGVYLEFSSPSMIDVNVLDNIADYYGGGMYLEFSNPTLNQVEVRGSAAGYGGGGMFLDGSNPSMANVIIIANESSSGGGMYLEFSNPTFMHVDVHDNIADYGGGMSLNSSLPELISVSIAGNEANDDGGGIFLFSSDPVLTNVTIANNSANDDGGGLYLRLSNPTLINSIIFGNSLENISLFNDENPLISYSNVQRGWEGVGNIDENPIFIEPLSGDYSLDINSPCIDAGTADLNGDGLEDITNYSGSAPDMGAYEYFQSMDYTVGDITMNGVIDILDVVRLVSIIMGSYSFSQDELLLADLNDDMIVDILDIVMLVQIIVF